MPNIRLSAESSLYYKHNKKNTNIGKFRKMYENALNNTPTHILPHAIKEVNGELQDNFNGFSPAVSQISKRQKSITQPEAQISINNQGSPAKANNREEGSRNKNPASHALAEKKKELGTTSNLNDSFQEFESVKNNKKTKPSVKNTRGKKPQNPTPAKRRGKKNADSLSIETSDVIEPATKRPRIASKKKAISTTESPTSLMEEEEKEQIPKKNPRGNNVSKKVDDAVTNVSANSGKQQTMSANKTIGEKKGRGRPRKSVSVEFVPVTSSPTRTLGKELKPQEKNQEVSKVSLKPTEKSEEKNFHFMSSSDSEVEDDDDIFLSNSSAKTKSPANAVPSPIFKTRTNKVSALVSSKTPQPVPLLRSPIGTLSLSNEFSPDRGEQSSDAEGVAGTESCRGLQKKTQLITSTSGQASEETPMSKRKSFTSASKTPSQTKRLQSHLRSSQQPNNPVNDIYGDDSGLIETAQKRTPMKHRAENSMNHRVTFSSAIDPSSLPVPHSRDRTTLNFYMAPFGDPVRAQKLLSNSEYNVSWIHLIPKTIFPLKIHNPMLVILLKGSVEFRSDPHAPSHIFLNSSKRFVDFKAGLILHVVNTGKGVASFQLTEILQ